MRSRGGEGGGEEGEGEERWRDGGEERGWGEEKRRGEVEERIMDGSWRICPFTTYL